MKDAKLVTLFKNTDLWHDGNNYHTISSSVSLESFLGVILKWLQELADRMYPKSQWVLEKANQQ